MDISTIFRIQKISQYYWEILQEEYFACMYSAPWMSDLAYEEENNNTQETAIQYLDVENKTLLNNPHRNFIIAGNLWFILIQYSKLIGMQIGNTNLSNIPIKFHPKMSIELIEKIYCDFKKLYIFSNSYAPLSDILKTWEMFCIEFGFQPLESESFDIMIDFF